MHRRWGQAAPDAKPYTSYTEEEFHRALERWKKEGKPEIFVFFKRVDAASEADAGPQLKKVMDFRKQLEETKQVLYHSFDDESSFKDEVDKHLRAYAKGELPKAEKRIDVVVLPVAALEKIEEAKKIAEQKAEEAEKARDAENVARLKVETLQLQIAEDAAKLSEEGKIEFARQKFVELAVESVNLRVLNLSYEFFNRTGDLNSAEQVIEKWLTLCGPDSNTSESAIALGNLGILYQTRGELERAGEMYRKALAIDEALGCKEGMASDYVRLGNLYKARGEVERAEEMYRKSLAIDEVLGRREGMARGYGNLGVLCRSRGELERAEEMHRKALRLFTELKSPQAKTVSGLLKELRGESAE
jgi:tetratricopeptide (TPR) repeat protein